MRKLIISVKSNQQFMNDAKSVMKSLKNGIRPKHNHYEISFESRKDFNKFVQNVPILTMILNEAPESIYELSKIADMNVSNLRRIVSFFEQIGAITIEENHVDGRAVKKPVISYEKIEFDLKAA